MTRRSLTECAVQLLQSSARLHQRRAAGQPVHDEYADYSLSAWALREALGEPGPEPHELADAAQLFLDAADEFELCRVQGEDLDAPARRMESAQRALEQLLSRDAGARSIPQTTKRPRTSSLKIVAAIDGSQCSQWAVAAAARLCYVAMGQMTLLHVIAPESGAWLDAAMTPAERLAAAHDKANALLSRVRDAVNAEHGLVCETMVAEGIPAEQIVASSQRRGADLIVIGTHGRGAIQRAIVGSTAQAVLRLATCPVLVVGQDPDAVATWNTGVYMTPKPLARPSARAATH